MQPVIPYRAGSYPPRGPQWPQFVSDTMQQTLTHEVHENLRQKREYMMPHHEDRLGYHGLLPRTEYYDIGETFDTQGTQTESSSNSQGTQSGFLSRSQGTQIDQDEGMPMETDMPEASSYGPMRAKKVRSSPMTGSVVTAQITPEAQAMEDDTATVNYEMSETETVNYEPLEIDHEMRTSSKRMIETDEDKKKKSKLSPMDPPKPKIKKEKKVVKPSGEVDDEVQVSAIQPKR